MATELEASVWGDEIDALESELVSTLFLFISPAIFQILLLFFLIYLSIIFKIGLSNDEIRQRIRAFDNEIRIMKSDINRIKHEAKEQMAHVKDNKEKIKLNKTVINFNIIKISTFFSSF